METNYVVCMTSHPARKNNLPGVLQSLMYQSIPPQRIWLTIYEGDWDAMSDVLVGLPDFIKEKTEICLVPVDTKVWKKFLPTLQYLPSGTLIMTADDDYFYPPTCASDLLMAHDKTHDLIAGNAVWFYGYKCHCGGCSLVFPEAFKGWREYADEWRAMPSDDMFYTLLAAKNGYRYSPSWRNWEKEYGGKYNPVQPYSVHGMVAQTYKHAIKLFGWV